MITQHDQVRFTPEIHGWFNIPKLINAFQHKNKMTDKNHIIISLDVGKAFEISNIPSYNTITIKIMDTRGQPNLINVIYIFKPTSNFKLNKVNLKTFPLKSGARPRFSTVTRSIQYKTGQY